MQGGRGTVFQFHYGTIKSELPLYPRYASMLFQFHYGTIKSISHFLATLHNKISIPLWYD